MSSSLSQEGLTNRCSSGNCGVRAFPVGPLVVRRSAHRHSTMSEGRTHTEEVRWDYGEGMRGCCMLSLCVMCMCMLSGAGRIQRPQSRVRVCDDERRAAKSSYSAASCCVHRPRDGVRWWRGVPARSRCDSSGIRRGRCHDGT